MYPNLVSVNASILCVDCRSQRDFVEGDCELRPPESKRCASNARYCTIIKEYDKSGKYTDG